LKAAFKMAPGSGKPVPAAIPRIKSWRHFQIAIFDTFSRRR
jgi:hypothetical protein